MAGKKKTQRSDSPIELITLAIKKLDSGYPVDAIELLRSARSKLRQATSVGSKKISVPPHYIDAQNRLPQLMEKALLAATKSENNTSKKLRYINEAIENNSKDSQLLVIRGLVHLIFGDGNAAKIDILKAVELQPDDPTVKKAAELLSPNIFRNLSELPENEPVVKATETFYRGIMEYTLNGNLDSAFICLDAAYQAASIHGIRLPWMESLTPYCYAIASKAVGNDLNLLIRCMRTILKISPDDTNAKMNLSLALCVEGQRQYKDDQFSQAVLFWDEALKLTPTNQSLIKNLALGYEKLGEKRRALECWRSLTHILRSKAKQSYNDPIFKQSILKQGEHVVELMLEVDCPDHEIQTELERAIKLDPENINLRIYTAELLIRIGYPQNAIKHIEFCEKRSTLDSNLLTLKANALGALKKYDESGKILDNILALTPSDENARRSRIILLEKQAQNAHEKHNVPEAIELRKKILELEPHNAKVMVRLGCNHFMVKDTEKAIDYLNQALTLKPDDISTHLNVAREYLNHEYPKMAEKQFKALQKIDNSPDTLFKIGEVYIDNNNGVKALKYFHKASKLADLPLLLEMAECLMSSELDKEAEIFISKAKQLDPTSPEPYLQTAMAPLYDPMGFFTIMLNYDQFLNNLNEAENLALANPEKYASVLKEIDNIRATFKNFPALEVQKKVAGK